MGPSMAVLINMHGVLRLSGGAGSTPWSPGWCVTTLKALRSIAWILTAILRATASRLGGAWEVVVEEDMNDRRSREAYTGLEVSHGLHGDEDEVMMALVGSEVRAVPFILILYQM